MALSTVNRLISLFQDSFEKLGVEVPESREEKLAFHVHCAMTSQNRNFHTPDHVFKICDGMKPVQVLAGLFHDIVYYQIDQGFPTVMKEALLNFVDTDENGVVIKKKFKEDNAKMVLEVFGFAFGQKLSTLNGMNEFLSALTAVKELESVLSLKHLLAISACIEGTIPFRNKDEDGKSCFEKLEERIIDISKKNKLDLAGDEVTEILRMAVEMGNKDVENFAYEDIAKFLDCTWELIPETNPILWADRIYSIKNYRKALMKMQIFMDNLNPDTIFHKFAGTPDDVTFEKITNQTHKNILIAREYLGIKLLSTAIIEAIALSTGGDTPISMFLGDVRRFNLGDIERAEDHLPHTPLNKEVKHNFIVLSLLETGRSRETVFDMRNSPFSSFLYKSLGKDKCIEYLNLAKLMFNGEINSDEFLLKLDRDTVSVFAKACAEIALTRRRELSSFF